MSRKQILLFTILLILLAIAAIIAGSRGSFSRRSVSFAVEEEREITRIVMSREGEESIILERNGTDWILNGKENARTSAVNLLLRTVRRMEIKSPVSEEMFEREIMDNDIEPVEVKVWSGRRLLTSFLLYSTKSNSYGNIMKRGKRSPAFILSVPGYRWHIGSHFNMDERYWLPFNIFSLNPVDIQSVELLYRDNPDDSFLITNPYISTGDMPDHLYWVENPDTTTLQRYFSYFIWVPMESYILDMPQEEVQSVTESPPFVTITVTSVDGSKEELLLWERSLPGEEGTVDTYRVLGMTAERQQLFVARYYDLDPVLRKRSYFSGNE